MDAKVLLYVAMGGALGAVLRYLIGNWLSTEQMPWGTLTVNLVGSLLLGSLMGAAASSEAVSKEMVLFLGVGVLGAFTTLSTFSIDTINLWKDGQISTALLYAISTSVLGPLLALFGWIATEQAI